MQEPKPRCTSEMDHLPFEPSGNNPYQLRVLGSQRLISIDESPCTIGTSQSNTLVLADRFVSNHHCNVYMGAGTIWLRDAGSRNGTWVNNIRVDRCEINEGARILLGRTSLQLVRPSRLLRSYNLIGEHETMQKVYAKIARFGPSLKPVLILGETGTGKELVARALHDNSPCRLGPFEPINCSAIPHDLAEAELFGHTQGAFTGASRERKGAFERADGGTLFLDEIGEMPMSLQPKLLRILEEGFVQRLGDDRRRRVSFRLIAATHRDLGSEVEKGRFRLDLFHRLAVGVIYLPSLQERVEDIPLLVKHLLEQVEGPPVEINAEAIELLKRQGWPGNIRQLRNALQCAMLEGDFLLKPEHFNFLQNRGVKDRSKEEGYVQCLNRSFAEIRQDVYRVTLKAHGQNHTAAAASLKIPKSTFADHLQAMGLSLGFAQK